MKFHRDATDIPTGHIERVKWVKTLMEHPVWNMPNKKYGHVNDFQQCVCIDPVFVREDGISDDNEDLNTTFAVWIEAGPFLDISEHGMSTPEGGWNDFNRYAASHDLQLDCGAPDLFEALLKLYQKVMFYYNDDGTERDGPVRCDDCTGKPYCEVCGFLVRK